MRVDQSIDLCPAEDSCVSAATAMTEHLLNAILPVTWHVTHNCLIELCRKAAIEATGAGTCARGPQAMTLSGLSYDIKGTE